MKKYVKEFSWDSVIMDEKKVIFYTNRTGNDDIRGEDVVILDLMKMILSGLLKIRKD